MTTFLLELPDELVRRLVALPREKVNAFAIESFSEFVEDVPTGDELTEAGYENLADFEDACQGIAAGLDDRNAGRLLSLEESKAQAMASLAARLGGSQK